MMEKFRNKQGFTLIELIVVIAIIGILAAVAVPAFITVVDQAHQANMDAVEGAMRSAVVMHASQELLDNGTYLYPLTADATIPNLIEDGSINDWTSGAGTWFYNGTDALDSWGSLAYVSADGSSYTITQTVY